MPRLRFTDFNETAKHVVEPRARPLLVNLWASWCLPCIAELKQFGENEETLRRAGIDILALSIDGVDENTQSTPADAHRLLTRMQFPFDSGLATEALLGKVDVMQQVIFKRIPSMTVPTSLLLDRDGRLAAIYRGPVGIDVLLRTVENLDVGADEMVDLAVPFGGRQYTYIPGVDLELAEKAFRPHYPEDAAHFANLAKKKD